MPADFPALPPGDAAPSLAEIAALLASAFPDVDRAEAARLLTDEVLPWDLRSLREHPRPRAYASLVYQGLASALGADRAQRRARLDEIVCDRRGQQLDTRIHGLAVARFVRDRGGGEPRGAGEGDLAPARPYEPLSAAEFDAQVAQAAADLAAWETAARTRWPSCFAARRLELAHDHLALDSARTGRFQAAAGQLLVFLRNAGERPREIDIH